MSGRFTGFTLVELLVVIAIIAILISITLPVLSNVRADAKTAICTSNIKQLNIALLSYEIQNGKFPCGFDNKSPQSEISPPGGWPGKSDCDKQGWWWFNYIADFLGKNYSTKSPMWCPTRSIKDLGAKKNILCGNYGVNQAICKSTDGNKGAEFVGMPLRTTQIRNPAGTFLLGDSGYATIMWLHATEPSVSPRKFSTRIKEDSAYVPGLDKANTKLFLFRPGIKLDALHGRHFNKTVNSGFVDGHVARLKSDAFYVSKEGNNYKNILPLWMP